MGSYETISEAKPETLPADFPFWLCLLDILHVPLPFGWASSVFGRINPINNIDSGQPPLRQDPGFQGGELGHHH